MEHGTARASTRADRRAGSARQRHDKRCTGQGSTAKENTLACPTTVSMQRIWPIVALPLVAVVVALTLYAVWIVLDLPPEETIIRIAKEFFERYGLLTVFVSAAIEGLLLIGWYFPGTLVVVLGLVLAQGNPAAAAEVTLLAILGLLCGYVANFIIGRYGWYRLLIACGLREPIANGQRRLHRHGLSAIFTTYWQPNLASVISTSAGILQYPFAKFLAYSFVATVLWISFWCTLLYILGTAALGFVGLRAIVIMIAVWIAVRFWRARRSRTAETGEPT
jgi:membrane protein DedA with SNARE-associated domain